MGPTLSSEHHLSKPYEDKPKRLDKGTLFLIDCYKALAFGIYDNQLTHHV